MTSFNRCLPFRNTFLRLYQTLRDLIGDEQLEDFDSEPTGKKPDRAAEEKKRKLEEEMRRELEERRRKKTELLKKEKEVEMVRKTVCLRKHFS